MKLSWCLTLLLLINAFAPVDGHAQIRRLDALLPVDAAASLAPQKHYISAEGDFLTFQSSATNLLPPEGFFGEQVYRLEIGSGELHRANVSTGGLIQGAGWGEPLVSASGRYVIFRSGSTQLVDGDTNGIPDLFMRDFTGQTTERINLNHQGNQAGNNCMDFDYAEDADRLVFMYQSAGMFPDDNNGVDDIVLRDRSAATTLQVSVSASGVQPDDDSRYPVISGNGRYVAFYTLATNLVDGSTLNGSKVVVKDLETGEVISLGTASAATGGISISADGDRIAFADSGVVRVHELSSGRVYIASLDPDGMPISGGQPVLSEDGGFVVFSNAQRAYLHDLDLGLTTSIDQDRFGTQANVMRPVVSRLGRQVYFQSHDQNWQPDSGSTAFFQLYRAEPVLERVLLTGFE